MTRSWRPDGDPITSAAGGPWMGPRWLRRRGPVRVGAGSARQEQHGRPLGSWPAAVVMSPAAVTEDWPWWSIGRLVGVAGGDTNRTRRRPTLAAQTVPQAQQLVAEARGVRWPEGRLFGHRLGHQLLQLPRNVVGQRWRRLQQ